MGSIPVTFPLAFVFKSGSKNFVKFSRLVSIQLNLQASDGRLPFQEYLENEQRKKTMQPSL